jgi:SAM-dependent methyltransferase
VYADTKATQADYDLFYREFSKYEDAAVATGGGTNAWDLERLERTADDLDRLVPDKNGALIDIGCANGGLLSALRRRGFSNVTGMDPSPGCASYVSGLGIPCLVGGLFPTDGTGPEKDGERFDVVILSHVLEHIQDLRQALLNCISWLKPGGILYVEVPDASRYHEFFFVPYYYFDCEHINHFDEHALKNLLLPLGTEFVTSAQKELPASEDTLYPACYGVFRKSRPASPAIAPVPDHTVRSAVIAYVEKSLERSRFQGFEELARSREELVVWGAGSYTLRLLENSSLGRCNIVAFVDNDSKKQGSTLRGVPVTSPEFLKNYRGSLVICTALHSQEIIREIKNAGYTCTVRLIA